MKKHEAPQEEDYFISMTDMMVGILLIFIILLMYFVLQFHVRTVELEEANRRLTQAHIARAEILRQIKSLMEKTDSKLTVEIDEENGVLRLPAQVLFESSTYALSDIGKRTLGSLAEILYQVLPCYVWVPKEDEGTTCRPERHLIEAVYVEGHTDSVPYGGDPIIQDNYGLSAMRSTSAFREIVKAKPELRKFKTGKSGSMVLSVSGYGPDRPVVIDPRHPNQSRNRRIELRIIMQTPRTEIIDQVNESIDAAGAK